MQAGPEVAGVHDQPSNAAEGLEETDEDLRLQYVEELPGAPAQQRLIVHRQLLHATGAEAKKETFGARQALLAILLWEGVRVLARVNLLQDLLREKVVDENVREGLGRSVFGG